MSYSLFVLSLLCLCAVSIAAFVCAFKSRSFLLGVFVPLIALCGSFIYFSYTSVLGYPVQKEWRELPNQVTVIYFRVVEKETITLWVMDDKTTRLIELPYYSPAEEALEGEREAMGQGIPVTFKKDGKATGTSGNRGHTTEGLEGTGRPGWGYKVESRGDPIPGGKLPPKY